MKRLLSLIVVLVVLVGAFTSCDMVSNIKLPWGNQIEEADIMDAIKELDDIYGDAEGSSTANDFELIAQLKVKDEETGISTVFTITWEASTPLVKIELVDGFWCVDVPEDLNEIADYTLTATITSEGGQKATIEFGRKLPAGGMGMIANPVVGTAYKFALLHGNEKAVVYFDGNNYNNYAWYLAYTTDPLAAVDVYLESVEGVEDGYRLYFNKDGEKTYIVAFPRDGDTTKGTLKLDTECPEEYYTWNAEYNTLVYTSVTGESFYIGSSGTYKSISLSAISYITGGTSYVAHLYGPGGVKEELPVQELPEIPENYTSQDLVDALYKLESGQTIEETYELTGIVTSIKYAYDPSYSNVSVNIVVEGREDKPVLLYRITGDGADTLKVGDTVTVRAGLTNYGGTYETTSGGLIINIVPGDGTVPGLPDNPGTDNPVDPKPDDPTITAPEAGKAYKLYLTQGNLNKTLYFTGAMSGNFLATTDVEANGADIYFEAVEGGYHVYFMVNGVKTYLVNSPYIKSNGYIACGIDVGTTPNCVWTYNTELGILEVYAELEGKNDTFFLGTHSQFDTMSLSGAYYKDQIGSGSQFPAYIKLAEGGTDAPVDPKPDTPAYSAPEAGKAYYFFVDQKGLNKTIYFNGNTADQRLLTGDKAAAVEIFFETTNGGYHIYVQDASGAKQYINTAPYLKDGTKLRCRIDLGATPNCVWTYDTALGILEADVSFEGYTDTFFFGTYDNYETISLSGSYYRNQIATGGQYPARIEAVDGSTDTPSQPDQPEQPDTPVKPGEDTAGLVGKAYKLYLTQGNLNKTLYFTGAMDGNFLATTDVEANGVDIYFEAVEGGYHVYFTVDGVKTYLINSPYIKSNGYIACGINVGTAPNCVWTYNTELGILEVYAELDGENDTFFLGTHSQFNTMSLSGSYYKDKIGDGSQFPAYIKLVEGGNTDTPSQPEQPEQPEQPDTPSQPEDGVMSIEDALKAANGTKVTLKGTVSRFYEEWSSYGNCSPYIIDSEGNEILIFRTTTHVYIGDQITVTGTITPYNEVNQIAKDGSVVTVNVAHTCDYLAANCLDAELCKYCQAVKAGSTPLGHTAANAEGKCDRCKIDLSANYVTKTLSFADKANRTSFDTSKQVWEQNGVKLTNNKGGSTSNVADYASPARFYKSSQIVIECKGMAKIEFVCNNSSYANALQTSIVAGDGVTVSIVGSVVTISFEDAVDSFTIDSLSSGQVRVNELEVTAIG